MKLTNQEKRTIENEMVRIINQNPNGIDTRALISQVIGSIASTTPNANRYHVSGMIAWVWKKYQYTFLIRTPGYSVIA